MSNETSEKTQESTGTNMPEANSKPAKATSKAKKSVKATSSVKPAEMKTTHRLQRGKETFVVPLSDVVVEEGFNKRTDESYADIEGLANSIETVGQLYPVGVCQNGEGKWVLTYGHRRYAALLLLSKRTGKEQTIRITRSSKDKVGRLIEQYTENVHQGTNDYDKALIIGGLLNEGMKQKEIAEKLAIPQPLVSRLTKLLNTPEDVQEAMRNKEISPGTVSRMLASIKEGGEALSEEVGKAKAAARAEGKSKATDRHTTAAGTRTPQTIMKQLVKKFQAKVDEEVELTDAEAFALAFCEKLLSKPSDRALNDFLRNYGK